MPWRAVFHAFQKQDQIFTGLKVRLQTLEDLLGCYAEGKPIPKETVSRVTQYATIGAGTLRRWLARTRDTGLYKARVSAVISLTGRSLDFAAVMAHARPFLPDTDRQLAAKLAREVAEVRRFLKTGEAPPMLNTEGTTAHDSLLRELEDMIALMPRVMEGSASFAAFRALTHIAPEPEPGFLVHDAFTNPEHLRFALSGKDSSSGLAPRSSSCPTWIPSLNLLCSSLLFRRWLHV